MRGTYSVVGRITRQDTGEGIHGLHVEAWDVDPECDDCLGSDLTNRDGSFRIVFRSEDFSAPFEGHAEVYLKVRDRDCRLIYDTRSRSCSCPPGEETEFNLSLVPETLWWHLSRPVSWDQPDTPLVPAEVVDDLQEAVELLAAPGSPGHDARVDAIHCALPLIEAFDNVLDDAWSTLQGNLDAAARFRDVVEALCSARAGSCCGGCVEGGHVETVERIFDEDWSVEPPEKCRCQHPGQEHDCGCRGPAPKHEPGCPCATTLVAADKVTLLVMAALHLSCGHRGTAKAYTLAILDQICRFELLGALHRSGMRALDGDLRSQEHFGGLVEVIGSACSCKERSRGVLSSRHPLCCCGACLDEELERCIRDAVRTWSAVRCYTVSEVQPPRACPGDELAICGSGFGDAPGRVRFRQKGGSVLGSTVSPDSWCDTRITVTVPEGAGCGLMLELPAQTARVCDRFIEHHPHGCIRGSFEGTSAEIHRFQVRGHADRECLEPGEPLEIRWSTCAVDRVRVQVIDAETGGIIAQRDPASPVGRWDFTPTDFTATTRLRVRITAEGRCEPRTVTRELSFVYQTRAELRVDGIEVTQAIQYYRADQHLTDPADRAADNSARLVTDKTAWVRTYLRSGLDPAFNGGRLEVVDGTLTVERRVGGVWGPVATLPSQNGPLTVEESFVTYDAERGNIDSSLNFVVPARTMRGLLRFRVNASSDLPQCPGNETSGETMVDVNLTQTLNAAFITIAYNGPDAAGNPIQLPAPTLATCQAETAWAMTTYPVSGAPNVRIAGTFTTNTPLNDPRSCPGCCSPNWGPLLQQVANLVAADQAANPGNAWVYYGIVAAGIPVNVPGCNGLATGGIAGQPPTYAHEIGHQFGLAHARCGNAGAGNAAYPIYEPYDLPQDPAGTTNWTMASIGEYGLDINNGNIANPTNAEDFMSYCGPAWISLFTHNFLINRPNPPRLVPQVIPTGSGAATTRIIPDNQPNFTRSPQPLELLIHVLGQVDEEGNVEVSSVARLETRYLVGEGVETDYLLQLISGEDRIVAQDHLYRFTSEGCRDCGQGDGGCDDCGPQRGFVFKALLDDREPGDSLRILRRGEVLWERARPDEPPELSEVSAEVAEYGDVQVSWELQTYSEEPEDVWIRWSDDEGRTWKALTFGAGGSATIATDQLPSGDVRFQVLAHDGFSTVSGTTDTVQLPAKSPAVTILYPTASDLAYAETRLHLWGTATSFIATLVDEQFVWFIDDEEVGRGRDIWVENPGAGPHTIRLDVEDEAGTGSTTSSIDVLDAGTTPTLS